MMEGTKLTSLAEGLFMSNVRNKERGVILINFRKEQNKEGV